ncbi:MAG TPA: Mur ligase family protein, partial [Nitrospiria bacterium]|nr:Mur ligase family protein [Nitrospiria bacterium]
MKEGPAALNPPPGHSGKNPLIQAMPSGYTQTLEFLYGLQWHGIKLGLENIRRLSKNLGDPHSDYMSLHFAGTNGKGSSAAITASILRAAGVSAGLYTSPHLRDFTERIQVNGIPIPEEAVSGLTSRIREAGRDIPLTFFEFTTAIAYMYFAERQVRCALFETGMGGRFDATNILSPGASVITNVDVDHQQYLGRTVREIAFEKAGIIKNGTPVVTAAERGDALDVIRKTA